MSNINTQYPYPISIPSIQYQYQYQYPVLISDVNIKGQYQYPIWISDINIKYQHQHPPYNVQYQLQYPISSSTANISSNVQNKINIMWSRQTNNNRASVSWFFQKSFKKQYKIGGYGYWVLILDMGIEIAYWY